MRARGGLEKIGLKTFTFLSCSLNTTPISTPKMSPRGIPENLYNELLVRLCSDFKLTGAFVEDDLGLCLIVLVV